MAGWGTAGSAGGRTPGERWWGAGSVGGCGGAAAGGGPGGAGLRCSDWVPAAGRDGRGRLGRGAHRRRVPHDGAERAPGAICGPAVGAERGGWRHGGAAVGAELGARRVGRRAVGTGDRAGPAGGPRRPRSRRHRRGSPGPGAGSGRLGQVLAHLAAHAHADAEERRLACRRRRPWPCLRRRRAAPGPRRTAGSCRPAGCRPCPWPGP